MSAARIARIAWDRRENLRALPNSILVVAEMLSQDATNGALLDAPVMTLRERGALIDLIAAATTNLYSDIVEMIGEDDDDPRAAGLG